MDISQVKFISPTYFNHKRFKRFLKRLRHLGLKVNMFYLEDNSMGFPPFTIDVNIKIKTIEHELWENNSMHHYVINGKYSFEIPADAVNMKDPSVFKYQWYYGGPANFIQFKKL